MSRIGLFPRFAHPGRCATISRILRKGSAGVLALSFFNYTSPAFSEERTEAPGSQVTIESLRPDPSFETYPVESTVGNVKYNIPRNYIYNSKMGFPILRVTFPGFEPLSESNKNCFKKSLEQSGVDCSAVELRLRLPKSNLTTFNNFQLTIGKYAKKYRNDELGYDVLEVGPEQSRTEIYWSESGYRLFVCNIFTNNNKRDGVCNDTVTLYDCNAVDFRFQLNDIPVLDSIERGVRELMFAFQRGKEISCPR